MTISLPDTLAAETSDAACETYTETRGWCTGKSVITVSAGCVHEHIVTRTPCQHHVEELAKGRVLCGLCADVDGHDCEMHLLREIPTP